MTLSLAARDLILDAAGGSLRNGLVAYWPLQDAGLVDMVGGNTLTNNNGATAAAGPGGRLPRATDFVEASTQFLSVAHNPSLAFTTRLSFVVWVNNDDLDQLTMICKGNSTADPDYLFHLSRSAATNRLSFYDGTAWRDGTGGTWATTGSWRMATVTYDGATWRFYVDAVAAGTVASTTAVQTGSTVFGIGAQGPGAGTPVNYMNGIMAGVGAWNRALSQQEITWLYNNGVPRAYPFRR